MEESELEAFRQEWRQEVSARAHGAGKAPREDSESVNAAEQHRSTSQKSIQQKPATKPSSSNVPREENDEATDSGAFHDLENLDDRRRLGSGDEYRARPGQDEPGRGALTALDHFETALEKESQGSLGDSLIHYRKAYRIDPSVDKTYRAKHYPAGPSVTKSGQSSSSQPGKVETQSQDGPSTYSTVSELIASFSTLSIPGAPPPTDQSPPPPCPIAALPSEVLVEILLWTAIRDVATFSKLGQVCKQFAYLFATEERIWKRICTGSEVGFGAMHYQWACNIDGSAVTEEEKEWRFPDVDSIPLAAISSPGKQSVNRQALSRYGGSWFQMFRVRPRIRFNGCYISTSNYVRPGAASASQVSWNSPVHIVTYYRYFRFFRDGTAISLLSTTEPIDVVHYLTKENLEIHRKGGAAGLPSAVMKSARAGRWRISGSLSGLGDEPEGELFVETEGADSKYRNIMHLTTKTAGRGTKNNKLNWRDFFLYNHLTEEWGEINLPHDKGYIWSRVKSYGDG